jgi:hypothetical protein
MSLEEDRPVGVVTDRNIALSAILEGRGGSVAR